MQESVTLDSLISQKQRESNNKRQENNRFRKRNNFRGPRRNNGFKGRRNNDDDDDEYDNRRRDRFNQNRRGGKYNDDDDDDDQDQCRLKISNLHYSVTEDDLKKIFEKIGEIQSCHINWDNLGRSQETAIIEYYNQEDAQRAIEQFDGQLQIENSAIEVEYAPFDTKVNKVRRGIRKSNISSDKQGKWKKIGPN